MLRLGSIVTVQHAGERKRGERLETNGPTGRRWFWLGLPWGTLEGYLRMVWWKPHEAAI